MRNYRLDERLEKGADSLGKMTNKTLTFVGEAVGLALLKSGKEDLAYKVITTGRDAGKTGEETISDIGFKTARLIVNTKEDLKDRTQERAVKSTADRINESASQLKEEVLKDSDKIKGSINKIKETITEKAKNIDTKNLSKTIEEKIKNNVDVDSIKLRLERVIREKARKRGYDFSSVDIDHTNDPFYNPEDFIYEDKPVEEIHLHTNEADKK